MEKTHKTSKKKWIWGIGIFIIVLLVALRLALPYIVKNYINKSLANIPGYYGQVADIDISLWRGAYVIEGLYLNKVDADTDIPFLDFKETDISVQWKALLNGKVVSEIVMNSPSLIYVFEDHDETPGEGEADVDDWTKVLTDIIPIDINRLEINDGKLAFVQVQANPNIDLQLNSVNLEATNLRNVVREGNTLPSSLQATAVSIGQGNVTLEGKMDVVKEIPDMDLTFSLKNADAKALNDLTNYYAGLDFSEGDFGIYSEMAINDGYLKGYIKPFLENSKFIGKEDGFLETLWEGFVGLFKFILKNQKENTLATKVPFEGDLNSVKTKILPSVTNLIRNAWIQAFKEKTDDTIDFEDAAANGGDSKEDKKAKREQRKAERQKKREEKKE